MAAKLDIIGLATPFFFTLVMLEGLILWRQNRAVRLNDAVADISCGMGDQVLAVFVKGTTIGLYAIVETTIGAFELPTSSPWTWLAGMLGVDLCYYAFHRFGHRVHLGWAVHVVHHQSEAYNLSVALRQPWFAKFYAWLFYLPLAWLGVPAVVYATCYALNLLYQFWIHTETIGKLGPLEWVLNTPSHHRVHHGTNEAYLDKNYGGILIVWDRLFGTFAEEKEPVVYGVLKPLQSWNPVWANVKPWIELARLSAQQATWTDKFKTWVMPPSWQSSGAPPYIDPRTLDSWGYDVDEARKLRGYILVNWLITSLLLGAMLTFQHTLSLTVMIVGAGYVFASTIVWAGLFEGRTWAKPVEAVRLLSAVVGGAYVVNQLSWSA